MVSVLRTGRWLQRVHVCFPETRGTALGPRHISDPFPGLPAACQPQSPSAQGHSMSERKLGNIHFLKPGGSVLWCLRLLASQGSQSAPLPPAPHPHSVHQPGEEFKEALADQVHRCHQPSWGRQSHSLLPQRPGLGLLRAADSIASYILQLRLLCAAGGCRVQGLEQTSTQPVTPFPAAADSAAVQ